MLDIRLYPDGWYLLMRGLGPKQQKILLLLMTLGTLSLTRSSRTYFHALKLATAAWREINDRNIDQVIRGLYRSKLIDILDLPDGTTRMKLSEQGKTKVLFMQYESIRLHRLTRWDKKWRVVLFDIPEDKKGARDALRQKLTSLGFQELQKSVLIYPFPCRDELDFLIEYLGLRRYVRILEATDIDVTPHLKKRFQLT